MAAPGDLGLRSLSCSEQRPTKRTANPRAAAAHMSIQSGESRPNLAHEPKDFEVAKCDLKQALDRKRTRAPTALRSQYFPRPIEQAPCWMAPADCHLFPVPVSCPLLSAP